MLFKGCNVNAEGTITIDGRSGGISGGSIQTGQFYSCSTNAIGNIEIIGLKSTGDYGGGGISGGLSTGLDLRGCSTNAFGQIIIHGFDTNPWTAPNGGGAGGLCGGRTTVTLSGCSVNADDYLQFISYPQTGQPLAGAGGLCGGNSSVTLQTLCSISSVQNAISINGNLTTNYAFSYLSNISTSSTNFQNNRYAPAHVVKYAITADGVQVAFNKPVTIIGGPQLHIGDNVFTYASNNGVNLYFTSNVSTSLKEIPYKFGSSVIYLSSGSAITSDNGSNAAVLALLNKMEKMMTIAGVYCYVADGTTLTSYRLGLTANAVTPIETIDLPEHVIRSAILADDSLQKLYLTTDVGLFTYRIGAIGNLIAPVQTLSEESFINMTLSEGDLYTISTTTLFKNDVPLNELVFQNLLIASQSKFVCILFQLESLEYRIRLYANDLFLGDTPLPYEPSRMLLSTDNYLYITHNTDSKLSIYSLEKRLIIATLTISNPLELVQDQKYIYVSSVPESGNVQLIKFKILQNGGLERVTDYYKSLLTRFPAQLVFYPLKQLQWLEQDSFVLGDIRSVKLQSIFNLAQFLITYTNFKIVPTPTGPNFTGGYSSRVINGITDVAQFYLAAITGFTKDISVVTLATNGNPQPNGDQFGGESYLSQSGQKQYNLPLTPYGIDYYIVPSFGLDYQIDSPIAYDIDSTIFFYTTSKITISYDGNVAIMDGQTAVLTNSEHLWNVDNQYKTRPFSAISNDGQTIVTAAYGSASLTYINDNVQPLDTDSEKIIGCTLSGDGATIILTYVNKYKMYKKNGTVWSLSLSSNTSTNTPIYPVLLSTDGTRWVVYDASSVTIYSGSNGSPSPLSFTFTSAIRSAVLSGDGTTLAVLGTDLNIFINSVLKFNLPGTSLNSIGLTEYGKMLITSDSNYTEIYTYDFDGILITATTTNLRKGIYYIITNIGSGVNWTTIGSTLGTATLGSGFTYNGAIITGSDGQVIACSFERLKRGKDNIQNAAISGDGRTIMTLSGNNKRVQVYRHMAV
jgi:hypothetical protein